MKKLILFLILISIYLQSYLLVFSQPGPQIEDPLVEAQEKLTQAKGNYKTIKEQEDAIKDMRRATKLSLRAAKLRAKAEMLQNKADVLVQKSNQTALSKGLYINNPVVQNMVQPQPPPSAPLQSAKAPTFVPVPGQPINIIVPKQEEVTYEEGLDTYLPEPPK